MVVDFHPSDILHYTDLWQFERQVSRYAINLAVLGEIDYARELINILLAVNPLSLGQFDRDAGVFEFAWRHSGTYPDAWPESLRSSEALNQLIQTREAAWGDVPEAQRSYDEAGLDACLDPKAGPIWKRHERLVKALDIHLRIKPSLALSKASDGQDALKLNDLDGRIADAIRQIASLWQGTDPRVHGADLASIEGLWDSIIPRLLVEAIGLSPKEVKARGSMLVAAVHQRLQHPHAKSMVHDKTIRELITIGDYNTVSKHASGSLEWAVYNKELPETLVRPPATSAAIMEAEARLGIPLPADYKEFLQITNGLGQNGVGLRDRHLSEMELSKVENLNWTEADYEMPIDLIEVGSLYYEITAQEKWKAENGSSWDMTDEDDFPQFSRYLVIAEADVYRLILVPPEDVRRYREMCLRMYDMAEGKEKIALRRALESFAGSMEDFEKLEWCCVDWLDESMYGHNSFRRWLEEKVSGSFFKA